MCSFLLAVVLHRCTKSLTFRDGVQLAQPRIMLSVTGGREREVGVLQKLNPSVVADRRPCTISLVVPNFCGWHKIPNEEPNFWLEPSRPM
eukprot:scaffold1593_cov156-Amphora_coffeaeformis.AAC.1